MTHTTHSRPAPRSRRTVGAALAAAAAVSATTAAITLPTATVSAQADDPVGEITADITRGGVDGDDRGVESDAGNLVADAQLYAADLEETIDADIAFVSPTSIGSDLLFAMSGTEASDGIVTSAEASAFQPGGENLFALSMTGEQITSVLKEQCQPGGSTDPVLHLGVSDLFTYDLQVTTQAGICTAIDVSNVQLDGVALVDTDLYTVVVAESLANGGDNFDTFAEVEPGDRTAAPGDLDALITYLTEPSPIDPPGTDRVTETLSSPQVAVPPVRLLDSRDGDEFTTTDGEFEAIGRLAADQVVELDVLGRGGVPTTAGSVNLQIGAILPDDPGFLTVYPCGEDLPLASSINFNGAPVVSNAVTSLVGDEGSVCIYTKKATDLYVDVNAYGGTDGFPVAITPARYLDDREVGNDGTFDEDVNPQYKGEGPLEADGILVLPVAGRGDVPDDAKAVILNVVAARPTGAGFLAVYPCEDETDDVPLASNVNYVSGSDFSNGVTTSVGTTGNVCITTSTTTNLVVDVNAYIPANGTPAPLDPFRLVDTRTGDEFTTIDGADQGDGAFEAGETRRYQITGRNFIPDDATSVFLNIAAVETLGTGYLTAFPCTDEVPNASNVNFENGDTVANSVQVPLTDDGEVCIFSLEATHFIMDIVGYITPGTPVRPAVT